MAGTTFEEGQTLGEIVASNSYSKERGNEACWLQREKVPGLLDEDLQAWMPDLQARGLQ